MSFDLKIALRPYQGYCREEFHRHVQEGCRNICIAIKTGTGKTYTSAAIAQDYLRAGGIIIFIAPRINLVMQTVKSYGDLGDVQIIQGSRKFSNDGKIYVASLQTLVRRLLPFMPALIIHDEKHNGHTGKSHKSVMEKFPNAIYLSLTATPFDSKGWPLKGFDAIIEYETTQWFIANDYLVDCECYAPVMPDLSKVKTTGGDYNEKELDAIMNNDVMIGNIIEQTEEKIVGKKTLFFAVTIAHAKEVAIQYKNVGFKAKAYHSKLHDDVREEMIRDFEEGKIDILVSVSALVMGFDVPDVDCLIVARPTKSQSFYRQLIGRGMRPAPGKLFCLLIDCAGVIKENGMPNEEVVPKIKKKKEVKTMECNKCGKQAKPISKSLKRVKGVVNYVTTWSCINKHTFETMQEAGMTTCPACSAVIAPGKAQFKELDNEYVVYSACECGEEIIVRTIPKVNSRLAKIEASRVTKFDLLARINALTKDDQKDTIEKFTRYIFKMIHPEMQQQCLSSLYVSMDMGLPIHEVESNLMQAVVDAALKTNHFKCLSSRLMKMAYAQTKDPINIVYIHNSRSINPMAPAWSKKTANKIEEFKDDFPDSEKWLLKAIKTRCQNIHKRSQKMASIFYFIDMLREKELNDNGGIV
jgi:DNA repair protein RadD